MVTFDLPFHEHHLFGGSKRVPTYAQFISNSILIAAVQTEVVTQFLDKSTAF